MRSRIGILATATPQMRQVVLLLLRQNVHSMNGATNVLRNNRQALLPGRFTATRDLPVAFELAEAIREVRRDKEYRATYRHSRYYGRHMRQQLQSDDARRVSDDRAVLARKIQGGARAMRVRLNEFREQRVLLAARRVMKHGASGGSRWTVRSGPEASYVVDTVKEWDRVNRGRDHWASLVDHHTITVLPRWLGTIPRIGDGSGIVDGRFLLDARPFLEAGRRMIWEAVLVRTGRGFQAVEELRWLSCYGDHVTVQPSLKRALSCPPPPDSDVDRSQDEDFLLTLVA